MEDSCSAYAPLQATLRTLGAGALGALGAGAEGAEATAREVAEVAAIQERVATEGTSVEAEVVAKKVVGRSWTGAPEGQYHIDKRALRWSLQGPSASWAHT